MSSEQLCLCAYCESVLWCWDASQTPSEISQRNTSSDLSLSLSLCNILLHAWFKVHSACRSSSVWGCGAVSGGPVKGLTCLRVICDVASCWSCYNAECQSWYGRDRLNWSGPCTVVQEALRRCVSVCVCLCRLSSGLVEVEVLLRGHSRNTFITEIKPLVVWRERTPGRKINATQFQ